MYTPWPVLNFNDIFSHQVNPSALLAYGFWRVLQKCMGSVVRADNDCMPQQMLAVLL